MKKLLVILLALAMPVMMFTGCAKESGTAETDGDTYKIGIVQMMEHPSLNTIEKASSKVWLKKDSWTVKI